MLKKTLVIMVLFMLVCTVIIPLCKAVTISPIIIDDVDIQPGEAAFRTFVVINESESEKTYFLHAKNFEPVGEEGQVTISAEEDPIGLASWIAFPVKSITLGSGQMQEIDFQIVAPPNAEPGGHYAAVFASTEPPDIDRGLGLAGNVGVLLLVRIEGDITEDIRVLEFHTRNSQNFYNRLPVFFDYRIENRGTVHVKPQGIIKLTGLFGDEVDANPNNSRSLPSSIRHIEAWWMGSSSETEQAGFFSEVKNEWQNFAIGKYKATLDIAYGKAGKTVTAQTSFWVFPWHSALVALVLVALIVVLVIIYNKLLIATARKRGGL